MNTLGKSVKRAYVLLFARRIFYPANLFLYKLSLFGLGLRNYENDTVSGEKAFIRFLKALKKFDSGAILDIGANVGNYSVMLRKNGINLPIYAFEPHPVAFRKLSEAAIAHNFIAVPEGAGEESSMAAIYDYQGDGGSEHASMYKGVIEHLHKGKAEEVAIALTTIDEFVARYDIRKIALLKIDTEGHELSVLKGAKQTIASGIAEVIQVEFNEMNIISRTFFKDIVDILPGYDFYRMLPDGLKALGPYNSTNYEIFSFQNIVALKKSIN
ncbi:FkbM family methyltransferase [Pedobacter sp. UBA5917]|jgi:FkbM family methyltransferase|uniref:FkbM family methyltransferase n=1 Tax=Pedobacter sp. UBA5917 TaxID=1947061 RepID=UPI0025E220BF|nr:FkbM family methyltransferase [Pedobacter sp. UBA5917]